MDLMDLTGTVVNEICLVQCNTISVLNNFASLSAQCTSPKNNVHKKRASISESPFPKKQIELV